MTDADKTVNMMRRSCVDDDDDDADMEILQATRRGADPIYDDVDAERSLVVVGWSLKTAVSPGAAEGKKVGVSKTPMASEGARAYNGDLGAYSHSGGPRGRALTLTSENWPRTSKLLQTAVILPTDSSLRYTSMRTLRAYCGRNVCWRSRNVKSVGERPGAKRRDRSVRSWVSSKTLSLWLSPNEKRLHF